MSFIQWALFTEDVLIAILILAFLLLRKNIYIIVSVIDICVLIFVNILVFRENSNEYLLALPLITCGITSVAAQAYAPQTRTRWEPRTTKIVLSAFFIVLFILLITSVILAQKLFSS